MADLVEWNLSEHISKNTGGQSAKIDVSFKGYNIGTFYREAALLSLGSKALVAIGKHIGKEGKESTMFDLGSKRVYASVKFAEKVEAIKEMV